MSSCLTFWMAIFFREDCEMRVLSGLCRSQRDLNLFKNGRDNKSHFLQTGSDGAYCVRQTGVCVFIYFPDRWSIVFAKLKFVCIYFSFPSCRHRLGQDRQLRRPRRLLLLLLLLLSERRPVRPGSSIIGTRWRRRDSMSVPAR